MFVFDNDIFSRSEIEKANNNEEIKQFTSMEDIMLYEKYGSLNSANNDIKCAIVTEENIQSYLVKVFHCDKIHGERAYIWIIYDGNKYIETDMNDNEAMKYIYENANIQKGKFITKIELCKYYDTQITYETDAPVIWLRIIIRMHKVSDKLTTNKVIIIPALMHFDNDTLSIHDLGFLDRHITTLKDIIDTTSKIGDITTECIGRLMKNVGFKFPDGY